ncbi:hypothetical protein GMORB2_6093 [Geosmithia morbida]|uniref:Uncharacterized protein n=1 Tax=Geosmithia morbida TaxID=1094350 RepID=A0A9P5D223_9HYPO|nr:uncharacterized protein GMORB2_6093 [Geosmithia morbida]KAF4123392.1 hypothetical protein GMORB2_6093 [Geosmithia morbida]
MTHRPDNIDADSNNNITSSNSMSHHRQSRSSPLPPHRRFDESWVEVSSQPSSSSLSSIGDEIVTTGLRVGGQCGQRRRLPLSRRSLPHQNPARYAASSQEEDYDDSDSGDNDDGHLGSSVENVPAEDAESDDDGDDATALGGRVDERPVFRPQPNAFTHPHHPHTQRSYSTNTMTAEPHPHSGLTRPSFSRRSQTRVQSGGGAPNFMSPSAREDNDEALRASLTTLLSCAAAARGLPKSKEEAEAQRRARSGVGPSNQPVDLRLVPESEMMGQENKSDKQQQQTAAAATASGPDDARKRTSPATRSPSRDVDGSRKSKRSASAGRGSRATKKKTSTNVAMEETLISPTLLTWVVSAGVVVLVSVVGFGAGYVIGREVGRQEAAAAGLVGGAVNETASSCGREAIRGSSGTLRRFKWSSVVGKSITA